MRRSPRAWDGGATWPGPEAWGSPDLGRGAGSATVSPETERAEFKVVIYHRLVTFSHEALVSQPNTGQPSKTWKQTCDVHMAGKIPGKRTSSEVPWEPGLPGLAPGPPLPSCPHAGHLSRCRPLAPAGRPPPPGEDTFAPCTTFASEAESVPRRNQRAPRGHTLITDPAWEQRALTCSCSRSPVHSEKFQTHSKLEKEQNGHL